MKIILKTKVINLENVVEIDDSEEGKAKYALSNLELLKEPIKGEVIEEYRQEGGGPKEYSNSTVVRLDDFSESNATFVGENLRNLTEEGRKIFNRKYFN